MNTLAILIVYFINFIELPHHLADHYEITKEGVKWLKTLIKNKHQDDHQLNQNQTMDISFEEADAMSVVWDQFLTLLPDNVEVGITAKKIRAHVVRDNGLHVPIKWKDLSYPQILELARHGLHRAEEVGLLQRKMTECR